MAVLHTLEAPIIQLPVAIDKHRLWSRLHIDGTHTRRTLDWWRMLDEIAAEARAIVKPHGTFRVFDPVAVGDREVRLSDGIKLCGLRQARLFQGAAKVALCGFTLGSRLEERCNSLAVAGDHPEASVLSIVGDCALAEGQALLVDGVASHLGVTFVPGASLQPGAPYWGIEANVLFFDVLPLATLGMTLLDSNALHPAKSKTFACAFRRKSKDCS